MDKQGQGAQTPPLPLHPNPGFTVSLIQTILLNLTYTTFSWRLGRRQTTSIFSCQRTNYKPFTPGGSAIGLMASGSAIWPNTSRMTQVESGVNRVLSHCCHFAVIVTHLGCHHIVRQVRL